MTELFITTVILCVTTVLIKYDIIAALPSWYGDELCFSENCPVNFLEN